MKKFLLFTIVTFCVSALMAQIKVTETYFKDDMSGSITGVSYLKDGKFTEVLRTDTGVVAKYDSLTEINGDGVLVGQGSLQNNVTVKFETPMNLTDSVARIIKITGNSTVSQKLYVLFFGGANSWDIWTIKSGYGNVDLPAGDFAVEAYVPNNEGGDFDFTSVTKLAFALNMWGWNDIAKQGTPAITDDGTLVIKSIEFGVEANGIENTQSSNVSVYPTVVENSIKVENASKVDVYSFSGVKVKSVSNLNASSEIVVSDLAAGMYTVIADGIAFKIFKK